MDGIREVGKYIKETEKKTERALKRAREPQNSVERVRDIFDSDNPMRSVIKIPEAAHRTKIELNFGRALPALGCCGDCMCGVTESYSSDSLISGSIYVTTPYVVGSTVVYIDGVLVTKGVAYVETDPTTGQITILVPSTTIVISYVYTVGNCTEACIDSPFTCMEYGFITGLSTVFADTFNRAGGTPYPSGGCGVYKTGTGSLFSPATLFSPVIVDGVLTSNSFRAYVGGQDNLVGATWEIIVGVEPILNTGLNITAANPYYTSGINFNVSVSSLGVLSISVDGGTLPGGINNAVTGSPSFAWEAGTRYWVRASQNVAGYFARIWPQDGDESGAYTISVPLGYNPVGGYVNILQPSLNYLFIAKSTGFILDSIQVGAGLDTGDWGYSDTGGSVAGYYCSPSPNDGYIRPVAFCNPEVNQAFTPAGTSLPSCNSWNSFPIFIPDASGLGIMIDYAEQVVAWNLVGGHPGGIKVTGQLTAGMSGGALLGPLFVQIKKYAFSPTLMTRNGFQGGDVIAGFSLPVNGGPVDVSFEVPGGPGPVTLWGMSILALDAYYASLPGLGFLNFLGVNFSNVTTKGLASSQCTAVCECMEVI